MTAPCCVMIYSSKARIDDVGIGLMMQTVEWLADIFSQTTSSRARGVVLGNLVGLSWDSPGRLLVGRSVSQPLAHRLLQSRNDG